MSDKTKSLTASEVARIVAISASKGTRNVFKAIAYLFATASIVFAIGLVWFMYEVVDEENSYGVVDFDCSSDKLCLEEQEILNDMQSRRIGDLTLWADFATEFEKSLPLALNGDVESQIFIALLYANGEGVHQDFDKALEWICKAAANNSFEASKLYSKISTASISEDFEPKQCNEY